MNRYVADFETTVDLKDCRVWAWGLVNIDTLKYEYGNNIESFVQRYSKEDSTIYFHNLKFDGEFLLTHLMLNGFEWRNKKLEEKTFSTLIADSGVWYQFKVKDTHTNTFINSLNIIPFSVEKVAQTFGLSLSKLHINYSSYREPNHELTKWEIEYLKNDCMIIAQALRVLFNQNLTKITQGGNALFDFKNIFGIKRFERDFPPPLYDCDIRSAYKGGFTYVNPKIQGKIQGKGIVLDVNSLYPWVMYEKELPYGEGIAFRGEYEFDEYYPLYIQRLRCKFQLKENKIPTIQIKNSLDFIPNIYLENSKDEDGFYQDVVLTVTNVDWELIQEQYEVFDIDYLGGYKFRKASGLFKEYIDKWITIKIDADKSGNKGMRQLAKLMLNALYGKFGLNPQSNIKIPYIEEGQIHYKRSKEKDRKPVYLPMAVFITAYAREKTIRSAQQCYERFLMSDTDSLHLKGTEIPDGIEVDSYKLGAWKIESTFSKAVYLRQKCYIEKIDGENVVHCAGMPKQCHQYVTFDNFKIGASYKGKLRPKHVPGGIVLVDQDFTIKP